MAFPWPSSPRAVLRDARAFFAEPGQRHRLPFALLAICMPIVIVYGFWRDAQTNTMPGRSITYVESWPADRPDEVIKAEQKIAKIEKDRQIKERQEAYQRLEKMLGM